MAEEELRTDLKQELSVEAKRNIQRLYELTKEQDLLQLKIGGQVDNSEIALIQAEIVNRANAVILEISRNRYNEVPTVENLYLLEKIVKLVQGYNDLIHDYNLIYGTDYRLLQVPPWPDSPTRERRIKDFRSSRKTLPRQTPGRTGWFGESDRHSAARKFGRAPPR